MAAATTGAVAARGAGAAACCALGPRAPPPEIGAGVGVPGIGVFGGSGSEPTAAPGSGVLGITGDGEDGVAICTRAATSAAPPVTFCVGASRDSPAARRAPHPPQNRESGSFWVPQLAQRIPAQA
jgi:hypothetical protein